MPHVAHLTDVNVDLLGRLVVSVTAGRKRGTGFYIADQHVLTSHHTVGRSLAFTVDGHNYDRTAVVYEDPGNDIAIIRVKQSVSAWLIPTANVLLNSNYMYISNVDETVEVGLIRADGFRTRDRQVQLRFADGQIKRGFSGSPVVDVTTGQLAGVIHVSADPGAALGGYATPNWILAEIRRRMAIDSRDQKCERLWEGLLPGIGQHKIVDIVASPLSGKPCFGRDSQLAELLNDYGPGWIGFINGPARAGKTALATAWLNRASGLDFSKRAYFDLSVFRRSEFPLLRVLQPLLALSVPADPFGERTQDETAALLRIMVAHKLIDTLVVFDAPADALPSLEKDLVNLIHSRALARSATVYCSTEVGPIRWQDQPLQLGPRVQLGPLDESGAFELLRYVAPSLGDETCRNLLLLVSDVPLWPEVLCDLLRTRGAEVDAYQLAEHYIARTETHTAALAQPPIETLGIVGVESLMHQVLGHYLDMPDVDAPIRTADLDRVMFTAANFRQPISIRVLMRIPIVQDTSATILGQAMTANALTSDMAHNLLEALSTADVTTVALERVKAELVRYVAFSTRRDPLGPVVLRSTTKDSLSRWLQLIQAARTRADRLNDLLDIDVHSIDHSVQSMELMRRQLRDLDGRHDFPVVCERVRRVLIKALPEALRTSLEFFELLSDSIQSSINSGYVDGLPATIQAVENCSLDGVRAQELKLRAVAQAIWSGQSGFARMGVVFEDKFFELIAEGMSDGSAPVLAGEFLLACSARAMSSSEFSRVLEWSIDCATSAELLDVDIGTSARLLSRIAVSLESSSIAKQSMPILGLAIGALHPRSKQLKQLAMAGNNRPILTLARQTRRLARLERATNVERWQSRDDEAFNLLRWVADNAPSAGAWLTLLNATEGRASSALAAGLLSDQYQSKNEVDTFRSIRAAYRKWAADKPITVRRQQIEYSLCRFEWMRKGSLLRMAGARDPRWTWRPIAHKLEVLHEQYTARCDELSRMENSLGFSEFGAIMRITVEAQYQDSLAQLRRNEPDLAPVDDLFESAAAKSNGAVRIELERARHLRHRRDFLGALKVYEGLSDRVRGDMTSLRTHRLDYSETLVNTAANGLADPLDYCTQAIDLVSDLTSVEPEAAIIAMSARLELDEGRLPSAAASLRDIFCHQEGYAHVAVSESQLLRELGSKAALDPLGSVATLVATDFTNPRLLVAFGAYLIRAFKLRNENGVETLRAGLNCLDGARIMSYGEWFPPVVNFHTGVALMSAVRYTNDSNPLGFGLKMGFRYQDDLAMAKARLQSAADLSIGSFRRLILDYLNSDSRSSPEATD